LNKNPTKHQKATKKACGMVGEVQVDEKEG
jgi:hypothetical protein